MKFGLLYNSVAHGTDPTDLVRVTVHAEACGFESILLPEHIVMHPGATLGGMGAPSTLAVADPFECLSFLAGATNSILLGTGVRLLPYRHPVVLAKQLATIDLSSRAGSSWSPSASGPRAGSGCARDRVPVAGAARRRSD